jgi:hypothetical protein
MSSIGEPTIPHSCARPLAKWLSEGVMLCLHARSCSLFRLMQALDHERELSKQHRAVTVANCDG